METDAVLTLLQDVAEQVVNPRFRTLHDGDVSYKSHPGDLVTVADREAEVLITQALTRAYPNALVLGEEASAADPAILDRYRAAEHAFTVDPVDGTRNFVRGSPDHAVMAAEIVRGEVVRAWIWQPQHRTSYVAERGAGAWRNGERLTPRSDREDLRGITSRRGWIGRTLGALRALELTWTCCGVDYPKLVEGAADYALYRRPKPWDHAPGSLLLSETGGFIGTFGGGSYHPQAEPPLALVSVGDRPTYDLLQGLVSALPSAV